MNKDEWLKQFLDPFKEPVLPPKPRKPIRTPEQMMKDAVAHFESLNLAGVSIVESEVDWILWFEGDTFKYRAVLKANRCEWSSGYQMWYYIASRRKR